MEAENLSKGLKEISVAEFFEKNKHILGYSNPAKALVTCVKEAIDNSLDATEEAGILPDILVKITRVDKLTYRVVVEDNGPGIAKHQIPKIFGKLLYGSRFHVLKQSRGQQGIGISSVVLYAQLTTGKPTVVVSKTSRSEKAWRFEITIDTKKNEPEVVSQEQVEWHRLRGLRVEFEVVGSYVKGRRQSVYEYIRQTSIVNPHAKITFIDPDGNTYEFERVSYELPKPPKEIKPHPHGIELGNLIGMLRETRAKNLKDFLKREFVRVGDKTAEEVLAKSGLNGNVHPKKIGRSEAKRLLEAFKEVNILPPPTDCLSPIGEELIVKSLMTCFKPEFVCAITRKPKVYSGNPFLVEVGLAYGVGCEKAQIMRFANRMPLLYQQGGCALTKAVEEVNWKGYGIPQAKNEIPNASIVFLIHLASTNIPYTSESKDAISNIPEITEEVRLALQEVGRRLKSYLDRKRIVQDKRRKESVLLKIIPLLAKKSAEILEREEIDVDRVVARIMGKVYVKRVVTGNTVKLFVANYTKSKRSFKLYEIHGGDGGNKTEVWDLDLNPDEEVSLEYVSSGRILNRKPLVEGLDADLISGADLFLE
jgi:DNA topoisomerase-6 subunit B